jgi:hypothetical protein
MVVMVVLMVVVMVVVVVVVGSGRGRVSGLVALKERVGSKLPSSHAAVRMYLPANHGSLWGA